MECKDSLMTGVVQRSHVEACALPAIGARHPEIWIKLDRARPVLAGLHKAPELIELIGKVGEYLAPPLQRQIFEGAAVVIGVVGIGLLGAGLFVTDPLNGYPPGTPDILLSPSVQGTFHVLFSALVFLGLPAACFVFARLFARWGEHKWAIYSVVTGIAFVVMFVITSAGFAQVEGLVNHAGLFQRITLTIGWAWLTLLAVYMLKISIGNTNNGKRTA